MDANQILETLEKAAATGATVPAAVAADLAKAALAERAKHAREVERLTDRAEEAEEVALAARPVIETLAKRADDLEVELDAKAQALDSIEKAQITKRESETSADVVAAIQKLGDAIAAIPTLMEPTIKFLAKAKARIRNEDGLGPFQSFKQFGEWSVKNQFGNVIAVCERRTDALMLVKEMNELELGIHKGTSDLDNLDERRGSNHLGITWPQPGETDSEDQTPDREITPGLASGKLDGKRIPKRRKRRGARLL